MTPTNWTLNTYVVATWTDLVNASAACVVKSLSIACGSSAANVQVRIANSSGVSRAMVVPASTLAALTGYAVDLAAFSLGVGDRLQIKADMAGVEFAAFGAQ